MIKICFLGAGSTIFARRLLSDIFSLLELAEVSISLFDIDPMRLATSEIVACTLAKESKVATTISSTTDRRAALDGADYAIGMFQVAGYKPGTVVDFEIPKNYGLRQTIADTMGIGGVHAGPTDNPRAPGYVPRYGTSVSGGYISQPRQSDGDELLGYQQGEQNQDGGIMSQCPGNGRTASADDGCAH
jgi:hypothetical protein